MQLALKRRALPMCAAALAASVGLAACDDASVGDTATPKSSPETAPEPYPSPPPREAGPPYRPGAEPRSEAAARAKIFGAWRAMAANAPESRGAVQFFFDAAGGVRIGSRDCEYEVGPRDLRIECPQETASGPFNMIDAASWTWTVGDTEIRFLRRMP